ncbi:MAG: DNA gyrase inhibitor YacG [Piscirickettsiaceae bacterium]|nr:MAG: DNA gyrase inhibitor YacG [Piscirickettsiaceae bacterium]
MSVNCPVCHKEVPWNNSQSHKPFCSDRCKLIDLGEWASEAHSIPGETVIPPEEEAPY